MKTLGKITLLAAGLTVAALPLVLGADSASTAAAPTVQRPQPRTMIEQRAAIARRVAKRLDLSADQKAQLKAMHARTRASVQAIRGDTTLSADQKKAKVAAALKSARAEMRGVLTAEQQAKLDKIRAHLKARHQAKV